MYRQKLDFCLYKPIPTIALWEAGIPVVIPQPARFAVHKLILTQRRHHHRHATSAVKDRCEKGWNRK